MTADRDRKHARRRRLGLLIAAAVAAAMALVPAAGAAAGAPAQAPRAGEATAGSALQPQGPFVTLLFSRTEMSAADNCAENDANIATLDGIVAPYMQSLQTTNNPAGLAGTGTLVTARTNQSTRFCTHYNDDLTASWDDATNLANTYGWHFVSHTATYPSLAKIQSLTPPQAMAETCGSLDTLKAHNLPGAAGMIAYPGSYTKNPAVVNLQTNYGDKCFDWGRQYDHGLHGQNFLSTASTTPPHWVYPVAVVGGPCADPTQPCYTVHVQNGRYTQPSTIINQIQRLKPGMWYVLQAYILVTGTNPKYTSNMNRWDCTSSNPAEHWSNVTVRYCWSDYQQILQAIAADPNITVTDPLTLGQEWGRPFN